VVGCNPMVAATPTQAPRGRVSSGRGGSTHTRGDRRADVVALIASDAELLEYVRYSSYGVATSYPKGDYDLDGDVDAADTTALQTFISGSGGWNLDFNRDGNTDGDDVTDHASYRTGYTGGTGGRGVLSRSGLRNRLGYAGYQFDDTMSAYHVRHRVYMPEIGRWSRRDPIGYTNGTAALGHYADSNPAVRVDAFGQQPMYVSVSLIRHELIPSNNFSSAKATAEFSLDAVNWQCSGNRAFVVQQLTYAGSMAYCDGNTLPGPVPGSSVWEAHPITRGVPVSDTRSAVILGGFARGGGRAQPHVPFGSMEDTRAVAGVLRVFCHEDVCYPGATSCPESWRPASESPTGTAIGSLWTSSAPPWCNAVFGCSLGRCSYIGTAVESNGCSAEGQVDLYFQSIARWTDLSRSLVMQADVKSVSFGLGPNNAPRRQE